MSNKQKEHTGYLGDLSAEQEAVLVKLRHHLRETWKSTDPRYDDHYLLRFCRARKFDYEKVQKMFDDFMKWRQENDIDNIATLDISPMKEIERNYLPHNYYCIDKEGRSVYIERYKDFDLKEIHKVKGR